MPETRDWMAGEGIEILGRSLISTDDEMNAVNDESVL